jgi:hypothetical protein
MTPTEFEHSAKAILDWIGRATSAHSVKWHLESEHPWCTFLVREFSTWDHDGMTQLVIACHDYCLRASVSNGGPNCLKVLLTTRERADEKFPIMRAHPTIEQAIRRFRFSTSVYDVAKELEHVPCYCGTQLQPTCPAHKVAS